MKIINYLALLFSVVLWTSCGDDSAAGPTGPVELGAKAPDFEVTEISTGKQKKLSDFKGKVVVAKFWWSKCILCNDKMDHLQTFISEHGGWGDDVVYLAVSIDPTIQSAKRHVAAVEAEENRSWSKTNNLWMDSDHGKSPAYAAYVAETGIPVSYIIDRSGKVAAIDLPTDPEGLDFDQAIGGLLK
jgi:cytochrome oxidase Cu insertion factor (SCO1/SenC/PrrC family)